MTSRPGSPPKFPPHALSAPAVAKAADKPVSRPNDTPKGDFVLPEAELTFTYARSSGKGGQNVNKVNSKAVLKWNVTESKALPASVRSRFMAQFGSRVNAEGELTLMADNHRDQARNAAECTDKLLEMVHSVWAAPKVRKKTKPTYGSKMRKLKSKKEQSEKKASRRKDW